MVQLRVVHRARVRRLCLRRALDDAVRSEAEHIRQRARKRDAADSVKLTVAVAGTPCRETLARVGLKTPMPRTWRGCRPSAPGVVS